MEDDENFDDAPTTNLQRDARTGHFLQGNTTSGEAFLETLQQDFLRGGAAGFSSARSLGFTSRQSAVNKLIPDAGSNVSLDLI